jgi:3-phenylpropionate/trans-cinnamate dioxygenase ferredoxin reductase subunit
MFGFLGFGGGPKKVVIEGIDTEIVAENKETILSAALRAGIAFPNSCRVGGCGTCKCQLKSGKVRELTEKAYILTAEELQAGYILGCQSIPKGDVVIHLDHLATDAPAHALVKTGGTIAARRALTHDIVELRIVLDAPMSYTAGQYASVCVPGVIDEPRSYSFASAPAAGGNAEIVFFVRAVPGGAMSNWLHGDAAAGQRVEVEGPFGDFRLRPSDGQLFAIAGGSGLAPVKALLEQALADGCTRPVVMLFGARTQKDLYCLDEFAALQAKWPAGFTFLPVLSHEPDDSDWQGARGLVTAYIAPHMAPQAQLYMCGPPPMIDAAIAEAQRAGVGEAAIFFDKFLDKSHTAAGKPAAG